MSAALSPGPAATANGEPLTVSVNVVPLAVPASKLTISKTHASVAAGRGIANPAPKANPGAVGDVRTMAPRGTAAPLAP